MDNKKRFIRRWKNILTVVFVLLLVAVISSLAHAFVFGPNYLDFMIFIGSGMLAYLYFHTLRLIREAEKNRT